MLVPAFFVNLAVSVPELASLPRIEPLMPPGTMSTAVLGICLIALTFISRRR